MTPKTPQPTPEKHLPRTARRTLVIAHVVASVGWLGMTLCMLVLAVTGATADSPAATEAAYRTMKTFGDWLLIPLALTTVATGLTLSLGTPWGLLRHRWVVVKLCITLAAATASVLAFRPTVNEAAAQVAAGEPVADVSGLVAPPIVSLSLYLFATAISYLKPWGLTARGQRHRAAARTARTTRRGPGPRAADDSGKRLAAAAPRQPV